MFHSRKKNADWAESISANTHRAARKGNESYGGGFDESSNIKETQKDNQNETTVMRRGGEDKISQCGT